VEGGRVLSTPDEPFPQALPFRPAYFIKAVAGDDRVFKGTLSRIHGGKFKGWQPESLTIKEWEEINAFLGK
jgi:hypothetical protein